MLNFYRLDERNIDSLPTGWEKLFVQICRWFLTKHLHIHKIEKIYVNIKTRQMSIKAFDRYESIFSEEILKTKLKSFIKLFKSSLIKWDCFKKFMQNNLNKMKKVESELLSEILTKDNSKKTSKKQENSFQNFSRSIVFKILKELKKIMKIKKKLKMKKK